MTDPIPPRRNLESLKKEAKRWLDAVQAGDADARARLARAVDNAPPSPTLRDVQHALAREHGFPGWPALKDAMARRHAADAATAATMRRYEEMADALLDAYRTGTPEAMERHYRLTWHRRAWPAMRTYVQLDLGKRPAHPGADVEITLDDARYLIAREHGHESWEALASFTGRHPDTRAFPDAKMSDAKMRELSRLEHVTVLAIGGCAEVTDEGVRHLAHLPKLTHLDLSGTAITDRGLEVLRHLPRLETLSLAGTHVTDEGMAHLAHCHELRVVNLGWTRTGDGALRALAGKTRLRHLDTGHGVTDEGLRLLHDLPIFKTWRDDAEHTAEAGTDTRPNQLSLRGVFTDRGMRHLRGLDGLFALDVDDSKLALTAAAMEPLASLPHLEALSADAKDDWMPLIAAMPRLRLLGIQDTPAGDEGFVALSRSRSIERIWGRRCHNLRRRGFVALANIPTLRSLSVSCLNVDDEGVSALPSFPALRELMPMDVPDAGYRHIGKCAQLESLVLMYCRETTDAATEHITGLRISSYFNSYTTITDRTPALLATMPSLRGITFDTCHGLTNAGVAQLARLPGLRELHVSGRGVSPALRAAFGPGVRVSVG